MTLGQEQREFTYMLGELILFAYDIGYELSLGRGRASVAANRADGGHTRSLHLIGLAQDLNLFQDGIYLVDGTGHGVLHDFWDEIGGAERIPNDLNHYSVPHNGMR